MCYWAWKKTPASLLSGILELRGVKVPAKWKSSIQQPARFLLLGTLDSLKFKATSSAGVICSCPTPVLAILKTHILGFATEGKPGSTSFLGSSSVTSVTLGKLQ